MSGGGDVKQRGCEPGGLKRRRFESERLKAVVSVLYAAGFVAASDIYREGI